MKQELNEVRIKLHITSASDVRNLWMCLNYDQNPTIKHVIDHIKYYYCLNEATSESSFYGNYEHNNAKAMDNETDNETFDLKLYLEEYWLPPCENSKLIRENDCIK